MKEVPCIMAPGLYMKEVIHVQIMYNGRSVYERPGAVYIMAPGLYMKEVYVQIMAPGLYIMAPI